MGIDINQGSVNSAIKRSIASGSIKKASQFDSENNVIRADNASGKTKVKLVPPKKWMRSDTGMIKTT